MAFSLPAARCPPTTTIALHIRSHILSCEYHSDQWFLPVTGWVKKSGKQSFLRLHAQKYLPLERALDLELCEHTALAKPEGWGDDTRLLFLQKRLRVKIHDGGSRGLDGCGIMMLVFVLLFVIFLSIFSDSLLFCQGSSDSHSACCNSRSLHWLVHSTKVRFQVTCLFVCLLTSACYSSKGKAV